MLHFFMISVKKLEWDFINILKNLLNRYFKVYYSRNYLFFMN